ncbi:uncharacterized protein GGS22DRAFT_190282 [Annulohypoxylon maeteangense]|uniref:uncharacterized protein n=1 Tax=Annulohypoxylon maeteangense TaxID=1927788 RepID=UPI002007647E|nr:uncharacterized protein GGS22DRAFT_190282 [Annulohypoxylon maeteangense]KAI0883624.1 hypothetical protein GGS22DRAFT_190282 [Annulohypoxylon maeteangense]
MSYMPLNAPVDGEEEVRETAELNREEWTSRSKVPENPRDSRMTTAIKCTAVALLLIGSFAFGQKTAGFGNSSVKGIVTEPTSLGTCPPDWQEAKEAGCVYDLVLSTWMHPGCFNVGLHEKYKGILRDLDFTYWLEPEMINEVSLEAVESGEHGWIWTDGRFHHLHCAYVMHRIHEASKEKTKVLDTLCRSEDHIQHCLWFNGNPGWEDVKALNTTRIFNEEYLVDCLIG